jgi:hypothetical protein
MNQHINLRHRQQTPHLQPPPSHIRRRLQASPTTPAAVIPRTFQLPKLFCVQLKGRNSFFTTYEISMAHYFQ